MKWSVSWLVFFPAQRWTSPASSTAASSQPRSWRAGGPGTLSTTSPRPTTPTIHTWATRSWCSRRERRCFKDPPAIQHSLPSLGKAGRPIESRDLQTGDLQKSDIFFSPETCDLIPFPPRPLHLCVEKHVESLWIRVCTLWSLRLWKIEWEKRYRNKAYSESDITMISWWLLTATGWVLQKYLQLDHFFEKMTSHKCIKSSPFFVSINFKIKIFINYF